MMLADVTPQTAHEPGCRILIIDHDRKNLMLLRKFLHHHGYQIDLTSLSEIDAAMFAAYACDLVLFGIEETGEDWLEILNRLRRIRPDVIWIMMTPQKELSLILDMIQQRLVDDYLIKPLDEQFVLLTIARCLEKLQLRRENVALQVALQAETRAHADVTARVMAIAAATRLLAGCANIKELGKYLLAEFAKNMSAQGGSLYVVEHDQLCLVHVLDPDHAPDTIPLPLDHHSLFARVIKEKQPILMKDIEAERHIRKSGWNGYQNGSVLVFPLIDMAGEVLGLLTLHNKMSPPFTAQDRDIGLILIAFSYEVLRATRTLAELQLNEQRYRAIFENIQDAYYETLLDGTIVEMSPSIVSVLQYERADVLGTSFARLYLNAAERMALLHQLQVHGKVTDYEITLFNAAQGIVPCAITAKLLRDEEGRAWKICGTIRNISKRKAAEAALRQLNDELEQRVMWCARRNCNRRMRGCWTRWKWSTKRRRIWCNRKKWSR